MMMTMLAMALTTGTGPAAFAAVATGFRLHCLYSCDCHCCRHLFVPSLQSQQDSNTCPRSFSGRF